MLIISDRANNVDRLLNIVQRIDQSNDNDIEIVSLSHASAAEIVRVLTVLARAPKSDGTPSQISLVADTRTNSVLIGGEKTGRLKIRALIAHLDTSLEDGDSTRVRYLRYADAESLAGKLLQHFSQQNRSTSNSGQSGDNQNINVWADKQTNAIIVNAPPKMMRSLMGIVDQLDIRRLQVLVEAIIVEIVADRTSELGVTWATDGSKNDNLVGVTNFPSMGSGVIQLAGINNANNTNINPSALIGEGISLGVGKITKEGTSFGAILRALEGIADTNIISTPSIVTTDNEEASLNVGQEVPFVTGSFSNTGGTGSVNPFQTIQREQVGVNLTITPQINEGDSILLKISQEISNISQSASGAVDLITNERTINTTVIVGDGDILVLGGLLEDQLRESDQRVPILGSIPIIGTLFKSKKTSKVKTNLMVFIRPTILENPEQATFETNKKYNYIRDLQIEDNKKKELSKFRGQDFIGTTDNPILPDFESYKQNTQ